LLLFVFEFEGEDTGKHSMMITFSIPCPIRSFWTHHRHNN